MRKMILIPTNKRLLTWTKPLERVWGLDAVVFVDANNNVIKDDTTIGTAVTTSVSNVTDTNNSTSSDASTTTDKEDAKTSDAKTSGPKTWFRESN